MKNEVWTKLAIILLSFSIRFTYAVENYGNRIFVSATNPQDFNAVINDFQQQLEKSVGQKFSLIPAQGDRGIILIKLDEKPIKEYEARMNNHTGESFLIQSDGQTSLKIVSYSNQGLINGIYTYLHKLGFRWYQPGDEGSYIPALKDVSIQCDEVVEPAFELRNFFGTFGTPRNNLIDKEKKIDREWKLWLTRNRMGGENSLPGHSGNEFLRRNMDALKLHPEYLAMNTGKRCEPATGAKFCSSNQGFQQLFVMDMVSQLNKLMSGGKALNQYIVSVEPSDGGGFCQCENCSKLGTNSDQIFFLANLVAREFQKISPKAFVHLYAYNTHAAPPIFDLEPNVLISLVPYKYQKYAKPGDMIEAWAQKSSNAFIRDYYGLPTVNVDKPLGTIWLENKLKYWHKLGIRGVTLESSYSVGATGPGLYLFSRLSWDMNESADKILAEYYRNSYGEASDIIAQAQEELVSDTSGKWVALKALMPKIQSKVNGMNLSHAQKQRLTAYKSYLLYLKYFSDWQQSSKTGINQAAEKLLKFSWGILRNKMVHQFSVTNYLLKTGASVKYVNQRWSYKKGKTENGDAAFAEVKNITDEEIEKLFEQECENIAALK
ncbi:MAG: DUF4838 domain-containing protein [Chitinophagales bacterium]